MHATCSEVNLVYIALPAYYDIHGAIALYSISKFEFRPTRCKYARLHNYMPSAPPLFGGSMRPWYILYYYIVVMRLLNLDLWTLPYAWPLPFGLFAHFCLGDLLCPECVSARPGHPSPELTTPASATQEDHAEVNPSLVRPFLWRKLQNS